MYQDEEYSSKNSSRLEICSEEDSSRLCFHWKISRDEKMSWKDVLRPLQKNLVNEKSSSNDFSRPGIIIKRFIGSGSTFRKIYQEEDLSSEYLSRRVVTSFKIFCRQRIVVERIIKTVGCHHIFSRRGNVVERFLQKRICYREVHQDEKFSSKKFWGRISFLEIEIIFKTNNLNTKYSTRRGDNQIFFKTRKYWRYTIVFGETEVGKSFSWFYFSMLFILWKYFRQHLWKIR